ncbi:response regulator [Pedobacter yonginense]|uniref:Response regulator n=1 Tax=Pedobacter yonginense TaxID=651869 RepID=A0A317ER48_9SPHI|nr:response regulator [Pedobacter yonginense]PWS28309.1 response regulator [Pedobacter yonginense]
MGKKIMVIDDDEDILSILEIILGDEGYESILYNTGANADTVAQLSPDLILLDVRIAGFPKTGVEICSEFKSDPKLLGIPILLISAEYNVKSLATACGADGFVQKPFDITGLVNQIKDFVS